jgi:RNA polymerase sigma factor (sigma-70 family)
VQEPLKEYSLSVTDYRLGRRSDLVTTTTESRSTFASETTTLARARRGDRRAFSRLMEPYRRELVAYCYRLTGTLSEAEDMAQEAFVRAYRALGSFEGRATPRAWLYRIAHNLCLNHVQRRPPGWDSLEEMDEARLPASEQTTEAVGQEREDLRLGFVALVQSLPPRQRAALVLRDVLGWSAEETARILETTVPAVKNALARARQTMARHPNGGDPADVRDLTATDAGAQAVIAQWVDAFEKGNTAQMAALLTSGDFAAAALVKPDETGYNDRENGPRRNGDREPLTTRFAASIGRAKEREERTDGQRQRAQSESPQRAR